MKKTIYLFGLLLLAGAFVVSSCKKDDDDDDQPTSYPPVLTFIGGGDYVDSDATLIVNEAFMVGINASENATSGKNIESFEVVRTFNNIPVDVYSEDNIGEPNYTWSDTLFANAEVGIERWTFTVTDKNGESTELAINITTEAGTTPLAAPEALQWQRVAGAPGTGLDMFGLKWESNVKDIMAVIAKDGAEKLVELEATTWTGLETVEDLMAAVGTGTDMEDFRGISATTPQTYDIVLATQYNGEYFLIHLTELTAVEDPAGSGNWTYTILGEYKK